MTVVADHIPVLETERLRLAAHSRAAWPAYRSIMMSSRAQYMDGELTEMEAWNAFTCEAGNWIVDNLGYWTVTNKASEEPVAFVGLQQPQHFPELELGWMTTEAAEGKGYAFEAATAVLDWAYATRMFETLVSYIDPENARSIALAKRLGAIHDENADTPGPDCIVYRHPRRAA